MAYCADVLVFLDADCLAAPEPGSAYGDAAEDRADTIWAGPVTYLPPPPETGYPLDDLSPLDDLHPARPASARAYHQHHEVEDPPVRHVDDIVRTAEIFWGAGRGLLALHEFERQGLVTRVAGVGSAQQGQDEGRALQVRATFVTDAVL